MADKDKETPVPAASVVGLTMEQLQAILGTIGKGSAEAMREASRQQRKENPNYPARNVFHPAGNFDDEGQQLPPKLMFIRDVRYVGVWIGRKGRATDDDLLTVGEIALCNAFTANKSARHGAWTATIEHPGTDKEALNIDLGSVKTIDDRMGLPPLTLILRELLEGADAVNPESLQKQIAALKEQVDALRETKSAAA